MPDTVKAIHFTIGILQKVYKESFIIYILKRRKPKNTMVSLLCHSDTPGKLKNINLNPDLFDTLMWHTYTC